jgi:hypothetical protein
MADWSADELRRIADAEELQIAPVRRNGELRAQTTIWAVRADGGIYVRAAFGSGGGWHRVARTSGQARVVVGDLEKEPHQGGSRP